MSDTGLLGSDPDAGAVDTGSFDSGPADPTQGDATQGDPGAAPLSLLATTAQPAAAPPDATPAAATPPDAAPAAPAPTDSGPNWITRIGLALAGGHAGITNLTPEQTADTGRHALLNFGLSLMEGAGPSYTKKSAGQIIAPALAAAEQTETGAEQAAAVQKQAAAELGLQQQDRQIKLAQFKFQMQLLQRSADAAQNMMGALKGGAPAAAPASGSPGSLQAALPPPDAGGNINTWQDPGAAGLVTAEATSQGVDPSIALAVAHQESGGNPNAPATDGGAHRGMFQIGLPEAASVGVAAPDVDTLTGNVRAGVGYLKTLIAKYGNVDTALVAYNAGQQRADDVVAGKATIPARTQQYIANVHNIVAGNPAGVASPLAPAAPAAPGAPAASGGIAATAAALAAPAPGDPGYVPSSGMRTTVLPGVAPGAGTAAPGIKSVGIADLPLGQRQAFLTRLNAAALDPAAAQQVMKEVGDAVVAQANLPRFRILNAAEAKAALGDSYQPTAGYAINQTTGEPTMFQSPAPPVPLQDTPEGQASKLALDATHEQLTAYNKQAMKAAGVKDSVAQLKALSAQMGGADVLSQQFKPLLGIMNTLGVGTPTEQGQMNAQQGFNAVVGPLALSLRPDGINRMSNLDLETIRSSLPNAGQGPDARMAILTGIDNVADRDIAKAEAANDQFNSTHSLVGFEKNFAKQYGSIVPTAPPANAPIAAHQAFFSSLKPGQVYIDPNGRPTMNNAYPR
jgi:soluble lytic murein transglycosylase-like protein